MTDTQWLAFVVAPVITLLVSVGAVIAHTWALRREDARDAARLNGPNRS